MPTTTIHMGRDTAATIRAVASVGHVLKAAPVVSRGTLPQQSPNLFAYTNKRYRGQEIGCCVGEAMAALAETSAKTPDPFQDGAPALPDVAFSQLFCYWLARQKSAELGVNLGGEGAIVSHALKGLMEGLRSGVKGGYRAYDLWPATDQTYASYRDRSPIKAAVDGTSIPLVGPALMLTYPEQILEYLSIGQPVGVGTPWTGGMQSAPDGRISWGGATVGGHAYQIVAYDMPANRIYGTNSWDNARYGVQPGGLFYTNLTSWMSMFTTRTMASGECEAMVIEDVGVRQAAGDWADAWGGRP